MPKTTRPIRFAVPAGFFLAAFCLGAALFLLGVFKPRAKCAEEDSATGCPATSAEAALVISGLAVAVLGLIAFWFARRIHSKLAGRDCKVQSAHPE